MGIPTVRIPPPPAYRDGAGLDYAKQLALAAQHQSWRLMLGGWVLVPFAALLAVGGSMLGVPLSGPFDGPSGNMFSGLCCSAVAVVMGAIGWNFLDRSAAATRLASVATNAIYLASLPEGSQSANVSHDHAAYEACVKGKAAWLEGRMNTERLEAITNALKDLQSSGKKN